MKHAKSYAREKAMKMLYQTHFNKNYEIETLKDPLAEKIVCEILDNEQTINGYITKYLKKWSILELNPVNLTILQVAIWEILYDETDNRIIISEALNLSQEYTDIKSKNFIHFVLDNVSKDSQKSSDE